MGLFRRADYTTDPWDGKPHAWGAAPPPVKHPRVTGPTATDDTSWFQRTIGAVGGAWRGDDLPATTTPGLLSDWWNGR